MAPVMCRGYQSFYPFRIILSEKTGAHRFYMKFLEKLRAEAHNAFHEEKKRINAEIERKREFEAMIAKHDEMISMRLRQIGDNFCKNFFFLKKKYKVHFRKEELIWTLQSHVPKSDIYPTVTIWIRDDRYRFSVEFLHPTDKFRPYECSGETTDLSEKKIEDMILKIAVSIAQATAAKNVLL